MNTAASDKALPELESAAVDFDGLSYEEAAKKWIWLQDAARESFYTWLRGLNARALRKLEVHFSRCSDEVTKAEFVEALSAVLPVPQKQKLKSPTERKFLLAMAAHKLFEDIDTGCCGHVGWVKLIEYVIAQSAALRRQDSETHTCPWYASNSNPLPHKLPDMRSFYEQVHFWPGAVDSVVVMVSRESDPRKSEAADKAAPRPAAGNRAPKESPLGRGRADCAFQLHHPISLKLKRHVVGHQGDVLSAVHVPEFDWVVTSGNDKQLCFWDPGFAPLRKWKLDCVVGPLCWAPRRFISPVPQEGGILFGADHFSERIHAWNVKEQMMVRNFDGPFCAASKKDSDAHRENRLGQRDTGCQCEQCRMHWELEGHGANSPAQVLTWIPQMEVLASAALDRTIRLWDMIQHGQRTHEFRGHSKGITCLEYVHPVRSLLSAGFDHVIAMWDPNAGVKCAELRGHSSSIAGLSTIPDSDFEVVSVDYAGTCKLWDVRRLECLQTFQTSDGAGADQEGLGVQPRAVAPLGKDRLLVAGRRMVLFERETKDPHVTSDAPLTCLAYCARTSEIFTPIHSDAGIGGKEAGGSVRVWSALDGSAHASFESVVGSNITALAVDQNHRRIAVGSEKGEIVILNVGSGHTLKSLTAHSMPRAGRMHPDEEDSRPREPAEVNQIEFIATQVVRQGGVVEWQPVKVVTMSAAAKQVFVHDDTHPDKSSLLKAIDASQQAIGNLEGLGGAGDIRRFSVHLDYGLCGVGSEDGTVGWYNVFSGKMEGIGRSDKIAEGTSVSHCRFLRRCPLMLSCDSACSLIFWSLRPLPTYDVFFHQALFREALTKTRPDSSQSLSATSVASAHKPRTPTSPANAARARVASGYMVESPEKAGPPAIAPISFGIASLVVDDTETCIYVCTDAGHLACVSIDEVCKKAERAAQQAEQKAKALREKGEGDASASGAGSVQPTTARGGAVQSTPKRIRTQTAWKVDVIAVHKWTVPNAHVGAVEHLVLAEGFGCLLSAGTDQVVRLWACASGECLGVLEQGATSLTRNWRLPIDAQAKANAVRDALRKMPVAEKQDPAVGEVLFQMEGGATPPEEDDGDRHVEFASEDVTFDDRSPVASPAMTKSASASELHKSHRKKALRRAASSSRQQCFAYRRGGGFHMDFVDMDKVPDWINRSPARKRRGAAEVVPASLPPLQSGLKRGPRFNFETIQHAHRLANAVEGLGDSMLASRYRSFESYVHRG
mmetsp:Transcript_70613/g.188204  ORF Transcript_70613/g.188204 Transcript_70613/m.188204 type:complete len:1232 (-) Transcript_70613:157-3852(-)